MDQAPVYAVSIDRQQLADCCCTYAACPDVLHARIVIVNPRRHTAKLFRAELDLDRVITRQSRLQANHNVARFRTITHGDANKQTNEGRQAQKDL